MTSIVIRAPTESDIDALTDLHFYMWNEFYKDYVPENFSKRWYTRPQCREVQQELVAGCLRHSTEHFARVAEIDGKIAAIAYITPPDPESDLFVPGFDAEFQHLYIWPEYRGGSLGSKLVRACAQWLRNQNYGSAYLWAFDNNPYSRRFGKKPGVSIAKQITRDYEGTQLALTAYGWRL